MLVMCPGVLPMFKDGKNFYLFIYLFTNIFTHGNLISNKTVVFHWGPAVSHQI